VVGQRSRAIRASRLTAHCLGEGLASSVGIMLLLLYAPAIVSSPMFGVIVDWTDLRRAAIISQSIAPAAIAVLFVLPISPLLMIWLLRLVALIIGFTSSAARTVRGLLEILPAIADGVYHRRPSSVSISVAISIAGCRLKSVLLAMVADAEIAVTGFSKAVHR
jgi:hypothetical protein